MEEPQTDGVDDSNALPADGTGQSQAGEPNDDATPDNAGDADVSPAGDGDVARYKAQAEKMQSLVDKQAARLERLEEAMGAGKKEEAPEDEDDSVSLEDLDPSQQKFFKKLANQIRKDTISEMEGKLTAKETQKLNDKVWGIMQKETNDLAKQYLGKELSEEELKDLAKTHGQQDYHGKRVLRTLPDAFKTKFANEIEKATRENLLSDKTASASKNAQAGGVGGTDSGAASGKTKGPLDLEAQTRELLSK